MELMDFIIRYGAQAAIVAFVAIFLVGCIKVIFKKPLEKLSKDARKPLYETLSIVFTYGLVALWIYARVAIFHLAYAPFELSLLATEGSAAYLAVKVMYPLYENYGLRALVRTIGNCIFKRKETKVETKDSNSGPTMI